MEMEMTDKFRRERLRLTSKARAENCSVDEISEMRKELMIEHYEKLKCANKPLPLIPKADTEVSSSSTSSETLVDMAEDQTAEIREQLKDWNYRKLDYLHRPLPVESPTGSFDEEDMGVWLERDDSGVQLKYVKALRYGKPRANLRR